MTVRKKRGNGVSAIPVIERVHSLCTIFNKNAIGKTLIFDLENPVFNTGVTDVVTRYI
jgi:hypothetical protein